jgi:hypothetical protein
MRNGILLAAFMVTLAAWSPAMATTYVWSLDSPVSSSGSSQVFDSNGINITAFGYLTSGSVLTALFDKNSGGDETGLGLKRDPSGQDEITTDDFVQLDFADPNYQLEISSAHLVIDSVQQGDGWILYGSNTQGVLGARLSSGGSGTDNSPINILPYLSTYTYLSVTAKSANVLLDNVVMDAIVCTPEPATFALVGMALLGLGAMLKKLR